MLARQIQITGIANLELLQNATKQSLIKRISVRGLAKKGKKFVLHGNRKGSAFERSIRGDHRPQVYASKSFVVDEEAGRRIPGNH